MSDFTGDPVLNEKINAAIQKAQGGAAVVEKPGNVKQAKLGNTLVTVGDDYSQNNSRYAAVGVDGERDPKIEVHTGDGSIVVGGKKVNDPDKAVNLVRIIDAAMKNGILSPEELAGIQGAANAAVNPQQRADTQGKMSIVRR